MTQLFERINTFRTLSFKREWKEIRSLQMKGSASFQLSKMVIQSAICLSETKQYSNYRFKTSILRISTGIMTHCVVLARGQKQILFNPSEMLICFILYQLHQLLESVKRSRYSKLILTNITSTLTITFIMESFIFLGHLVVGYKTNNLLVRTNAPRENIGLILTAKDWVTMKIMMGRGVQINNNGCEMPWGQSSIFRRYSDLQNRPCIKINENSVSYHQNTTNSLS